MNILIGSGFSEKIRHKKILEGRKNFGNSHQTIREVKSNKFFIYLKKNNIKHPKTHINKLKSGNFLIKNYESFGTQNLTFYENHKKLKKNEYFQEFIDGDLISVQFLRKKKTHILSICSQENILKNKNFITDSLITKNVNKNFFEKIKKLTEKIALIFNLYGLNNLDLVIKDKNIFLIEVNPRPGLSFKIIERINKKSIQRSNKFIIAHNQKYFSTTVVYAKKKIIFNEGKIDAIKKLYNYKSFSEIPCSNDIIKVDEPICLVHLESEKKSILKKKIKEAVKCFLDIVEN